MAEVTTKHGEHVVIERFNDNGDNLLRVALLSDTKELCVNRKEAQRFAQLFLSYVWYIDNLYD